MVLHWLTRTRTAFVAFPIREEYHGKHTTTFTHVFAAPLAAHSFGTAGLYQARILHKWDYACDTGTMPFMVQTHTILHGFPQFPLQSGCFHLSMSQSDHLVHLIVQLSPLSESEWHCVSIFSNLTHTSSITKYWSISFWVDLISCSSSVTFFSSFWQSSVFFDNDACTCTYNIHGNLPWRQLVRKAVTA